MNATPDYETLCKDAKHCLRHGENEKAIELFASALELDPTKLVAHQGIATAYFLTKQYKQAAEHFTCASEIAPLQGNALINLGAVYNRMGEYQQAMEVLRRGLRKDRNSAEGYYNLGYSQKKLDQPALAVTSYRKAIEIAPQMIDAHQNLANIYFHMNNFRQATIHYRLALEINPDFERAKAGLARVEEGTAHAVDNLNPFGRLVTQESVHVDEAPHVGHELTEDERFEDRKTTHSMANLIETNAKEFRDYLRDEFEPSLAKITRAAIEAADNPDALEEAHEAFRATLRTRDKYRQNLTDKTNDLKAHEEKMSSS